MQLQQAIPTCDILWRHKHPKNGEVINTHILQIQNILLGIIFKNIQKEKIIIKHFIVKQKKIANNTDDRKAQNPFSDTFMV